MTVVAEAHTDTAAEAGFAIYVHWPFCRSKCPYCDFNSHVREAINQERWRAALLRELDHFADETVGRTVTSVFFGGGTPSLMEPATAAALIDRVAARWPVASDVEITLEANPTSVEAGRFAGFRAAGVNRASLGVQALDDAALRFLGRGHSAAEALAAVDTAARHFARFSFDLIYARPGQTAEAWTAELHRALDHAGGHLSAYQLTIEPGTAFHTLHRRGGLPVPDEDTGAALYETTQRVLDAAGLRAYEISNHARPGEECRHNLTYWRYGDYVGIGPGAHGRLTLDGAKLATRTHRAPEAWLALVERGGHAEKPREPIEPRNRLDELMMMGLRLTEGVNRRRAAAECGADLAALLDAAEQDRAAVTAVPGAVTPDGAGPTPGFVADLDDLWPARDLLRHRRKYFIGALDPAASVEFSRGCPWDCAFCSAWTFYGRSYRIVSPERAAADMARIREPGVFIVDDVAFIHAEHGFAIGEAIARRGISKKYYLETRGDVLLRNKEVFEFWKTLGLRYMFLGLEAIDEDGLKKYRKRVPLGRNFEALEFARSLGIRVAINIIADTDWDRERFAVLRDWCQEIPEVVNISVNTPYPGTETWMTEGRRLQTRDYRLFDIQHAVLPTRLPLDEFYRELVATQQVLNRKHLGWRTLKAAAGTAAGHVLRGQTNFVRMLWKFNEVYNPDLLLADHHQPVRHAMTLPPPPRDKVDPKTLYVHGAAGRRPRTLDRATERFVAETRG